MKLMIQAPSLKGVGNTLLISIFIIALTACGGGNSSGKTILKQVKEKVASGTVEDLEAANDLLLNNQDTLSAADFEAVMDALGAV